MKNGIIFIVFLFYFLSPLSLVYSFLFSLTSLFSHLCFLSSVLYEEWYKFAPILFSLTPSPIHHRRSLTGCILHHHRLSLQASSSSLPIGIDVGIDVEARSESTLRWDRSVRHDRGHRRWDLDHGHRRWGEVRSWSWVAGASGFWLLVQVGCRC